MKKFAVIAALVAAVGVLLFAFGENDKTDKSAYLRIHIRANSNGVQDQNVKYLVRDRVVEFLTPAVSQCATKAEAKARLSGMLGEISSVAEEVLRENGFSYGARAEIRRENFPTRVYEDVTLEAGVYDALILELGGGEGDNWWCVVYPPLCFSAGSNIVYRSRIAEIIKKFFGEKERS